jgi:hypothetical protein
MKIPGHCAGFPPLLGERAIFSSELIFGVRGGFQRAEQFRLVTAAATVLATILEFTLADLPRRS